MQWEIKGSTVIGGRTWFLSAGEASKTCDEFKRGLEWKRSYSDDATQSQIDQISWLTWFGQFAFECGRPNA